MKIADKAKALALKEIQAEDFSRLVEKYKAEILAKRGKSWWANTFPWRIVIININE